jgi:ADP-ribose pyrophosphatase
VRLREIEIVEDLTAKSRCDEGFLRLRRLRLRNVYADGVSEVYPCDVVSRPGSDAVVAVLYEKDGEGRVHVLLREGVRPPIYLRKLRRFHHPDRREYLTIAEVIAGLVEAGDGQGEAGMQQRAAIEAREEAGCEVPPREFRVIGGETFASPGTSDEKVYYCAGPVRAAELRAASGDGSVMEEVGRLVSLELAAAIEACRRGDIPDMKTELALFRLCDHLGFLPQLGCFASELPEPLRARYRRLGIAGRE